MFLKSKCVNVGQFPQGNSSISLYDALNTIRLFKPYNALKLVIRLNPTLM
ncbi:unnamed protein product [Schistosoma mattheei]|uniref:Uncharacterized protein n=1 Tax=Schistosoma mattheei TaxID=31246 RepID=A0A3P8H9M0_9TREM|nr:unnamed protein product [Schistosoma mattheei]